MKNQISPSILTATVAPLNQCGKSNYHSQSYSDFSVSSLQLISCIFDEQTKICIGMEMKARVILLQMHEFEIWMKEHFALLSI